MLRRSRSSASRPTLRRRAPRPIDAAETGLVFPRCAGRRRVGDRRPVRRRRRRRPLADAGRRSGSRRPLGDCRRAARSATTPGSTRTDRPGGSGRGRCAVPRPVARCPRSVHRIDERPGGDRRAPAHLPAPCLRTAHVGRAPPRPSRKPFPSAWSRRGVRHRVGGGGTALHRPRRGEQVAGRRTVGRRADVRPLRQPPCAIARPEPSNGGASSGSVGA